LYWHIVNIGTTDVVVTHVCGKLKKKPTQFFVPDFNPIRLKPGDYTQAMANDFPSPDDITCLYVSDSLSREWKAPGKSLKAVRKDYKPSEDEE